MEQNFLHFSFLIRKYFPRLDKLQNLVGNTIFFLHYQIISPIADHFYVYYFSNLGYKNEKIITVYIRFQFQAFVCSGMVDCFIRIYKEESLLGLFKGLQPAMLKAAFVISIYFTLYERILIFLKERNSQYLVA